MKNNYQYLSKSVYTPSPYLYRKGSYDSSNLSTDRQTVPSFTRKQRIESLPLNSSRQSREQSNPEDYSLTLTKHLPKNNRLRHTLDQCSKTKICNLLNKQENQYTSFGYQLPIYGKCQNVHLDQKYQDAIQTFEDYLDKLKKMKEQIKKLKDGKKDKKKLDCFHNDLSQNNGVNSQQESIYEPSFPNFKHQSSQSYLRNNYKYSDEFENFKKRKTPIGSIPMTPNPSTYERKLNGYQKQREDIFNNFTEQPNHNKSKITTPKQLSITIGNTPPRSNNTKYEQYYQYNNQPWTNISFELKNISNDKQKNSKYHSQGTQINNFIIGKIVGEGKFGVVYQAFHKPTGWLFAIKKIPKNMITSNLMIDQFILELKIQTYLYHENVLSLYTHFDDKDSFYLVLEYMEDGTLFNYLKKRKKLTETEVAVKVRQIASAVKYLHDNEIAHRDIKPENIVLSHGVCKLCDFGWATICSERRKTYCGTFDYAPPQILQGIQYDYTADLWCLGVLTYELLVGKAPFYHISRKETMKKILNVEKTNVEYPTTISKTAIHFMDSLIKKDPKERLSGQMLLEHPFLKNAEKNGINKN